VATGIASAFVQSPRTILMTPIRHRCCARCSNACSAASRWSRLIGTEVSLASAATIASPSCSPLRYNRLRLCVSTRFNRASPKLYRSGIFILVPRAGMPQRQSIDVVKLFAGWLTTSLSHDVTWHCRHDTAGALVACSMSPPLSMHLAFLHVNLCCPLTGIMTIASIEF